MKSMKNGQKVSLEPLHSRPSPAQNLKSQSRKSPIVGPYEQQPQDSQALYLHCFLLYKVQFAGKHSLSPRLSLASTYYLTPQIALEQVDQPMWRAVEQLIQDKIEIRIVESLPHLGELERYQEELKDDLYSMAQGRSFREVFTKEVLPRSGSKVIQRSNSSETGTSELHWLSGALPLSHYYPSPFEQYLASCLAGRRLILSEIETAYTQNFSVFHSPISSPSSPVPSLHPVLPTSLSTSDCRISPESSNSSTSSSFDPPATNFPPCTPENTAALTRADLLLALQRLYLFGYIEWLPAIGYNNAAFDQLGQAYCRRCGYNEGSKTWLQQLKNKLWHDESQLIPLKCRTCGKEEGSCLYCPQCLQLGVAKSCEPYVFWAPEQSPSQPTRSETKASPPQHRSVQFDWNETLSPAQQQASDQLSAYVQSHTSQPYSEFLVWAICGSGKTEMIFATLYDALCQGQKVLITSPRKDVILELAPRLKAAFPATKMVVLHGDSKEKYEQGELFLATTHQCLRFYQYFDVVIIDEVDAFPYRYDQMLQNAVHRAKKQKGMLIYLSATPSEEFQRRVEKGTLPHVLISKRYHGHPLAVPQIKVIGKWRTWMHSQIISSELAQFVSHLITQKRYGYLFVPHVKDLPLVQSYLQTILLPYLEEKGVQSEPPFIIEAVYAEHPQRTEIVQRFRQHRIHLLLTTTILERGVTIPFCDVGVLGSDDPVFHTAALIQMAGRAGRKIQDPIGQVFFFPESVTNAQMKCIKQIKKWNEV